MHFSFGSVSQQREPPLSARKSANGVSHGVHHLLFSQSEVLTTGQETGWMNPTVEGSHSESTTSMPRMMLLAIPQTASPQGALAPLAFSQVGRMASIFTLWALGLAGCTEALLVPKDSGVLISGLYFSNPERLSSFLRAGGKADWQSWHHPFKILQPYAPNQI